MVRTTRICALTVLLAGSASAVCQSTLPPTAPTHREVPEHPATVEYSDGQVAVVADNSSLNDILREVARHSGMAVRGSVVDERVFGTYGPAAPAEVLTALLKGTESNMIVVSWPSRPAELILTPKQVAENADPQPRAAGGPGSTGNSGDEKDDSSPDIVAPAQETSAEAKPAKADEEGAEAAPSSAIADPAASARTAEIPGEEESPNTVAPVPSPASSAAGSVTN